METLNIPVKSILISHSNREKIDAKQLEELAATIQTHGLLQPPVCTPHPAKKGKYDLIAGERRLRAVQKLGWQSIDVRLLPFDTTEDQVRQIRLIENLQRVDLTPWEEASQLAELCEAGGKIDTIAVRLGRTPQWVAVRLAFRKLIPELRAHVEEQDWPLKHLPLLARVPVELQPEVLAQIRANQGLTDDDVYGEQWTEYKPGGPLEPVVPSYRQLEEFLDDWQRVLASAPWKLDDAGLLPQAGACETCPKRSSAQTLLFPELAESRDDRCLDAGCWKAKQGSLIALNVNKLHDKGQAPILLKAPGQVDEQVVQMLGPVEFKQQHDYVKCKKSDPEAVPAVFVNGEDAGKTEYVKPQAWVSGNGQADGNGKPARAVDPETGEREEPSNEERLITLKQKRQCRAVEIWAEKLETFKPAFKGCVDWLLIFFGSETYRGERLAKDWTEFAAMKANLNADGWARLWPVFQARLSRTGSIETQAHALWLEATDQARALNLTCILEFCWKDAVIDCPLSRTLAAAGVEDETAVP